MKPYAVITTKKGEEFIYAVTDCYGNSIKKYVSGREENVKSEIHLACMFGKDIAKLISL